MEERDARSLLLGRGTLATYPFAAPKIQAGHILEGDLFVMDHESSLRRRRQKPSTSALRGTETQEGTDSLSSPQAETFYKE